MEQLYTFSTEWYVSHIKVICLNGGDKMVVIFNCILLREFAVALIAGLMLIHHRDYVEATSALGVGPHSAHSPRIYISSILQTSYIPQGQFLSGQIVNQHLRQTGHRIHNSLTSHTTTAKTTEALIDRIESAKQFQ